MTLIPLILSLIALFRLRGTDHRWLFWSIVAVTVFAWLVNQAVRNSNRMELTGQSDHDVTRFWVKMSMGFFVANFVMAIWGIVASF